MHSSDAWGGEMQRSHPRQSWPSRSGRISNRNRAKANLYYEAAFGTHLMDLRFLMYRFRGCSLATFEKMIHRLFTICDHSSQNSASFDDAGDDAIAFGSKQAPESKRQVSKMAKTDL